MYIRLLKNIYTKNKNNIKFFKNNSYSCLNFLYCFDSLAVALVGKRKGGAVSRVLFTFWVHVDSFSNNLKQKFLLI